MSRFPTDASRTVLFSREQSSYNPKDGETPNGDFSPRDFLNHLPRSNPMSSHPSSNIATLGSSQRSLASFVSLSTSNSLSNPSGLFKQSSNGVAPNLALSLSSSFHNSRFLSPVTPLSNPGTSAPFNHSTPLPAQQPTGVSNSGSVSTSGVAPHSVASHPLSHPASPSLPRTVTSSAGLNKPLNLNRSIRHTTGEDAPVIPSSLLLLKEQHLSSSGHTSRLPSYPTQSPFHLTSTLLPQATSSAPATVATVVSAPSLGHSLFTPSRSDPLASSLFTSNLNSSSLSNFPSTSTSTFLSSASSSMVSSSSSTASGLSSLTSPLSSASSSAAPVVPTDSFASASMSSHPHLHSLTSIAGSPAASSSLSALPAVPSLAGHTTLNSLSSLPSLPAAPLTSVFGSAHAHAPTSAQAAAAAAAVAAAHQHRQHQHARHAHQQYATHLHSHTPASPTGTASLRTASADSAAMQTQLSLRKGRGRTFGTAAAPSLPSIDFADAASRVRRRRRTGAEDEDQYMPTAGSSVVGDSHVHFSVPQYAAQTQHYAAAQTQLTPIPYDMQVHYDAYARANESKAKEEYHMRPRGAKPRNGSGRKRSKTIANVPAVLTDSNPIVMSLRGNASVPSSAVRRNATDSASHSNTLAAATALLSAPPPAITLVPGRVAVDTYANHPSLFERGATDAYPGARSDWSPILNAQSTNPMGADAKDVTPDHASPVESPVATTAESLSNLLAEIPSPAATEIVPDAAMMPSPAASVPASPPTSTADSAEKADADVDTSRLPPVYTTISPYAQFSPCECGARTVELIGNDRRRAGAEAEMDYSAVQDDSSAANMLLNERRKWTHIETMVLYDALLLSRCDRGFDWSSIYQTYLWLVSGCGYTHLRDRIVVGAMDVDPAVEAFSRVVATAEEEEKRLHEQRAPTDGDEGDDVDSDRITVTLPLPSKCTCQTPAGVGCSLSKVCAHCLRDFAVLPQQVIRKTSLSAPPFTCLVSPQSPQALLVPSPAHCELMLHHLSECPLRTRHDVEKRFQNVCSGARSSKPSSRDNALLTRSLPAPDALARGLGRVEGIEWVSDCLRTFDWGVLALGILQIYKTGKLLYEMLQCKVGKGCIVQLGPHTTVRPVLSRHWPSLASVSFRRILRQKEQEDVTLRRSYAQSKRASRGGNREKALATVHAQPHEVDECSCQGEGIAELPFALTQLPHFPNTISDNPEWSLALPPEHLVHTPAAAHTPCLHEHVCMSTSGIQARKALFASVLAVRVVYNYYTGAVAELMDERRKPRKRIVRRL